MLVLAFISLFAGIQAGKYAALASTGFACNLREGIYSNIQNFAFSNIDKYSTAGLITRMTTDVTNVQNAYQMILRIAVRAPLMMICSMVMCFVINPTLSLIFLGALIFLGFVLFFIIYKVTPIFFYTITEACRHHKRFNLCPSCLFMHLNNLCRSHFYVSPINLTHHTGSQRQESTASHRISIQYNRRTIVSSFANTLHNRNLSQQRNIHLLRQLLGSFLTEDIVFILRKFGRE